VEIKDTVNSSRQVRAFAPATVANVVCGFDVFGFAVHKPGDTVTLRWRDEPGVIITSITGDGGQLPLEAARNTAGAAVISFLEQAGIQRGVEMELAKGLPLGSGMGSSAASAVAALVAVNALSGCNLSRAELLPIAMESERLACGSAHADNAAPGLYGGFVLVRSYDPLDVVSIPFPDTLRCVLVHPDLELKTRDARRVLRGTLSLKDAVTQWGNTAGMVAGLMKGDLELIGRSMEDKVAEPVRSLLIPGYDQVRQAARAAGAIGCGISGSGPTMFAFCQGNTMHVADAMQRAFLAAGLSSSSYHSRVDQQGAIILDA